MTNRSVGMSALVLTLDDLPAGTYPFRCTVDDHVACGMEGTLTAK
jgi:uncharacterized cupredoxin-like copper-binding protein